MTGGNRQQQTETIRTLDANSMKPAVDKVFSLEAPIETFCFGERGALFGETCIDVEAASKG